MFVNGVKEILKISQCKEKRPWKNPEDSAIPSRNGWLVGKVVRSGQFGGTSHLLYFGFCIYE